MADPSLTDAVVFIISFIVGTVVGFYAFAGINLVATIKDLFRGNSDG